MVQGCEQDIGVHGILIRDGRPVASKQIIKLWGHFVCYELMLEIITASGSFKIIISLLQHFYWKVAQLYHVLD
jgi:hypothetical protein